MSKNSEKIPGPKELEKEIGDFLSRKFGDSVKLVSPIVLPQDAPADSEADGKKETSKLNFDLTPEQLVSYLDQYIVKQDAAKSVLATKICTHFNRVKRLQNSNRDTSEMVGSIKSNILMIGPTGVGKTYMVKLIAQKIGVPFVKGDATKFSETGYVGGDVEDLVRDLVREADNDIELAQQGIIYIDEIDKIASSQNIIGHDVSRSGVQRALLKPMEETDVELKVPHDPISMIQEIEQFRKSGKRERRVVNTKNILFIMSGAFGGLSDIISKRINRQPIGFGSDITLHQEKFNLLQRIKSEDLIEFGFETEFIGRLPIRAIFETLTKEDLYEILKNPNNPIILGKKLDFDAYDIDIKFENDALRYLADDAFQENTGARGLVSSVERALMRFEHKLPSTPLKQFPVTKQALCDKEKCLQALINDPRDDKITSKFNTLALQEKDYIKEYIISNRDDIKEKYNLTLSPSRVDIIATYYGKRISDVGDTIRKVKHYYDEVKKLELYFFNKRDINIILEDDAVDFIIEQFVNHTVDNINDVYKKMVSDFECGLNLAREKTGKNRFFLTRDALIDPEKYIGEIITGELSPRKYLTKE